MSASEHPEPEREKRPAAADSDSGPSGAPGAEHGDTDGDATRELRPEDQARVDAFLKRGVNSVERKPFRPIFLMIMLIVVVAALSFLAQGIARMAGVY